MLNGGGGSRFKSSQWGVAGTRCLGEWKEWSGIELRNWLSVLFFFVFARLKPHTHAHTKR